MPRRPAIVTIPEELRPDSESRVVALYRFSDGRERRVREQWSAYMARRQGQMDDDTRAGVELAQQRADAAADDDDTPLDPLDECFAQGRPPHLVVAECLHFAAPVAGAEAVTDAPRMGPEQRAEWVDDQWSPVVRWLAEQLVREAGLVRETETERGEGSGPAPGP